jgi:uncharacterized protein YutE (UPF0331/DUF86 family)
VTDREVLFRKLTSLREHVARMRRRRPDDVDVWRRDLDRQDALGMSLVVAVQDALDIALHLASGEGWGVPVSYAASFRLLSDHGVVETDLAAALAAMAALRDRFAHGYATVDMDKIWSELPAGLAALDAFAAVIAARLGRG